MPTLYGPIEIAQALGVTRQAVWNWRARGKMPEPTAVLTSGPVWSAEVIEPWIAQQKEVTAGVRATRQD